MKSKILLAVALLVAITALAQGQPVSTAPPGSAGIPARLGDSRPDRVPVSAAQSAELKKLDDWAMAQVNEINARLAALNSEFNLRRTIIVQRAALEAGLSAKQLDTMDLFTEKPGVYEWRPKEQKSEVRSQRSDPAVGAPTVKAKSEPPAVAGGPGKP